MKDLRKGSSVLVCLWLYYQVKKLSMSAEKIFMVLLWVMVFLVVIPSVMNYSSSSHPYLNDSPILFVPLIVILFFYGNPFLKQKMRSIVFVWKRYLSLLEKCLEDIKGFIINVLDLYHYFIDFLLSKKPHQVKRVIQGNQNNEVVESDCNKEQLTGEVSAQLSSYAWISLAIKASESK